MTPLLTARGPPMGEHLFDSPLSQINAENAMPSHGDQIPDREATLRSTIAHNTKRKLKTNHDTFSINYHWSFWRRLADPRK